MLELYPLACSWHIHHLHSISLCSLSIVAAVQLCFCLSGQQGHGTATVCHGGHTDTVPLLIEKFTHALIATEISISEGQSCFWVE